MKPREAINKFLIFAGFRETPAPIPANAMESLRELAALGKQYSELWGESARQLDELVAYLTDALPPIIKTYEEWRAVSAEMLKTADAFNAPGRDLWQVRSVTDATRAAEDAFAFWIDLASVLCASQTGKGGTR